ncbi:unnamed protein product [Prorocentrum cordatum]|uniref:Uncharacterized protein n=1 Tax=Prorocentrum cordatum TaxID=2364126 RepID=A0ABN9UUA4_9DINO|nr:unnamed protein product [Polarella glacialis]
MMSTQRPRGGLGRCCYSHRLEFLKHEKNTPIFEQVTSAVGASAGPPSFSHLHFQVRVAVQAAGSKYAARSRGDWNARLHCGVSSDAKSVRMLLRDSPPWVASSTLPAEGCAASGPLSLPKAEGQRLSLDWRLALSPLSASRPGRLRNILGRLIPRNSSILTGADQKMPAPAPFQAAESVVPVAQLGQESLALLAWLRGPASQLDSLRPAAPGASIDVYAKPGAAAAAPGEGGAAGAAGDAQAQAAPARRDSGHVAPEVPQVPAHTQSCGRAAAGDAHAPRGQDDEEGEGGRSERRRGGRGRGGGRRGGGPQRGQPGQGSAGGGRHPTASGDAGGAAAAGGCAASGCAGGAGCFDPRMAGATGPGHVFTQVPMYVGKGSCAGMAGSPQQQHALWAAVGASAAAGRGAMLGQPCGGKGSQAGAMDPQQWAAMMPMWRIGAAWPAWSPTTRRTSRIPGGGLCSLVSPWGGARLPRAGA